MNRRHQYQLPVPLAGFENINRYWDKRWNIPTAKILPGQFYVSTQGEMISTVLGSCISACIRDKNTKIGGMNHFMLPAQRDINNGPAKATELNSSMRYGNWAMEYLINEILKQGGSKCNLEIKLFGGGQVLQNMTNIGKRNIDFVRKYLINENLHIIAEDLGDIYPRKVLYFSDSGAVKMKKLRSLHNNTIQQRETEYIQSINRKPTQGTVELF
ncbi:chemoreceptor glutamine deamidase CheD [Spartinivicinus poritis]|uniref:Probable chemoreceptor glutamine deamidase CheD n=1 Tax=Spartinivicinus poritis TaxID=2994640 RepID=A0ABT5U9G3_9GAMM|nr:chemoreceptor glutamine deamidase CheD [Spartinivicinus sp. A2-2]MDE1462999.1 chemoreceptor glutamine deamidase CheD [Spartinivicinus sp. A2-2]